MPHLPVAEHHRPTGVPRATQGPCAAGVASAAEFTVWFPLLVLADGGPLTDVVSISGGVRGSG